MRSALPLRTARGVTEKWTEEDDDGSGQALSQDDDGKTAARESAAAGHLECGSACDGVA